jgi:hypothetical protein
MRPWSRRPSVPISLAPDLGMAAGQPNRWTLNQRWKVRMLASWDPAQGFEPANQGRNPESETFPSTIAAQRSPSIRAVEPSGQGRSPSRAISPTSQERPTRSSARIRFTDHPCSTCRACRYAARSARYCCIWRSPPSTSSHWGPERRRRYSGWAVGWLSRPSGWKADSTLLLAGDVLAQMQQPRLGLPADATAPIGVLGCRSLRGTATGWCLHRARSLLARASSSLPAGPVERGSFRIWPTFLGRVE